MNHKASIGYRGKKFEVAMIILFFIAFIDSFVEYISKVSPLLGKSIVIFDRYFYDHVIDYLDVCPKWLVKCYLHLIPEPDIIFILDLPPEIAYERKKERSRARKHYLSLARRLRNMVVIIDANVNINEINSLILHHTTDFLRS